MDGNARHTDLQRNEGVYLQLLEVALVRTKAQRCGYYRDDPRGGGHGVVRLVSLLAPRGGEPHGVYPAAEISEAGAEEDVRRQESRHAGCDKSPRYPALEAYARLARLPRYQVHRAIPKINSTIVNISSPLSRCEDVSDNGFSLFAQLRQMTVNVAAPRKVVRDGQVLIIRGDEVYTVLGETIQ